ncbi:hypothetical protein ACFV23_37275, partial [Streptomyces sp. NPDC059627]
GAGPPPPRGGGGVPLTPPRAPLGGGGGGGAPPHAGDMMQVHQHLVGTVLSEVPPLVEFIPWTQEAFVERSVVREGLMERPQGPGASTAIDPAARVRWQIPGVGSARTL